MDLGDASRYGQDKMLTPDLDQMATEGLRFTVAYTGSLVYSPFHATFM